MGPGLMGWTKLYLAGPGCANRFIIWAGHGRFQPGISSFFAPPG